MENIILLALGFLFTFFVPGFVAIEVFFKELPSLVKLPLYLLTSVLISTYAVYIVSLLIGFSKRSILITFSLSAVLFILLVIKRKNILAQFSDNIKKLFLPLFISIIIFIMFFLALFPAIFSYHNGYYVMSAVNWQDTAMHLSIIQSIAQGNFPPQAPYFSGQPLNYYFLIDFHSAILQKLYNEFLPQILIFDNPFFPFIFFLSIYSLSFDFFKKKLVAVLSGILILFSGNFLYIQFFKDLFSSSSGAGFLEAFKELAGNKGYTLDYGKLMQMTPYSDYFLQNRPMMLGLPAVVLIMLILKNGFEKDKKKYLIFAGLLTGSLIKFQLFAFGVSLLIFIVSFFIFLKSKRDLSKLFIFFIPLILFVILSSVLFRSNNYVIESILANFRFGVWDKTKDFQWYLLFPFANFGIPFSLFLISLLLFIKGKILLTKSLFVLLMQGILLFIIPYAVFFTVYDGDMLKFFYFALIPFSLIAGLLLQKVWGSFRFGFIAVILILLFSSMNGFLTLGWSFFNKYIGYSKSEYDAGIWIRNNTPPSSVFATMPTVHSPVSDIGGRLRVLSYTTWPYSHGFNRGEDNVFKRQRDMDNLYQKAFTEEAKKILKSYNIKYIYLGSAEREQYVFIEAILKNEEYLELVYDLSGIKIYKVL